MDTGLAAECVDDQSGIIGKCWPTAYAGSGKCLDVRVFGECRPDFFRLWKTELAGGLRSDSIGREEFAHFLQLAWIVGGNNH
jgi:hypothetical protein